ncbi:MAG: phage tail protein [Betaproteobacteria bacterium]|nr:phage tail protein [Betaproteobacteria bacterium]
MGGKSKKTTIGYWYALGLHMGLCRGPVDEVVEVQVGEKRAYKGSLSADSTGFTSIRVNKRGLFGGEKREGGLDGTLHILFGKADMQRHAGLTRMLGGLVPAFRGVTTAFWDGWLSAMNPYLKHWSFRVRRTTEGWENGCWYPEKAAIWMDNGQIKAMNPAHILYQVYTDTRMGRGLPPSFMDDASWRAVADKLHAEGFGLCLKWTRQDTIDAFGQIVLNHIGGGVHVDRQSGKIKIMLIRDDYNPAALPLFDADSGLLEVEEFESMTLLAAPNEIIVKFVSPADGKEREVRARNAASLAVTDGAVISETREYPGIPTSEIAGRVALRDLKITSGGLKKCNLKLDRRAALLVPGDVFRISAPELGITNMILRAGRVEYGEGTDGTVTIEAIQDVFGMPSASYHTDEESGYVPPEFIPRAAPDSAVFDSPYREILRAVGANEARLLDVHASFVGAVAESPGGLHEGYDVATRTGNAPFTVNAEFQGTFCPVAELASALTITATTATLPAGSFIPPEATGEAALIGEEIVRVVSFNEATGVISLGRGCLDTVPQAHDAGTRIWFYGAHDDLGYCATEYAAGTNAQVKLLTRMTNGERLAEGSAPTVSLLLTGRQGRPYPPGSFRINGQAYPASITLNQFAASMQITWAHRDRLLQADLLVDTLSGSMGPEPGTTYRLRITDDAGAVVADVSGLTGTSWTWQFPPINLQSPGSHLPTGAHTFLLESIRDGVTSYQRHEWTVVFP